MSWLGGINAYSPLGEPLREGGPADCRTIATLIIGIDPDVDASGVAVLDKTTGLMEIHNMRFFELLDFMQERKERVQKVVVEGGWLHNKANWHKQGQGERVAARIGKNSGSNHEAGRKIVEMMAYVGVPCEVKKPLKKHWKGTDGKITHAEFQQLFKKQTFTRSNQEQRDAALLIIGL